MKKYADNAEFAAVKFDPEWFRMVPSEAIQFNWLEVQPEYTAAWDMYVTKAGRVFFPICAELYYPSIVQLYEYLPATNSFRRCFKVEDVTIQPERTIRASKIHTSITEIRDGRLIMTTHTTARSPEHPEWLPQAYFGHPWEGFQGSHILIYDQNTDEVEDRGIPVPFESIYGAKYDEKHNCLYFTGYMRGHLFRYDLDTNRVTDYGKVTEFGSFRISEGPDGNFYSSSRSGNFYRINTTTQEIEELGIRLPDNNGIESRFHRIINFSANWNGKMYLTPIFTRGLWVYDPADNSFESVGDLRPVSIGNYERRDELEAFSQEVFGMAFDDEGVLWYGYICGGLHLVRWDLFHGGVPENMGMVGVQKRCTGLVSEMLFHDGKLYWADTNHSIEGPGIGVIDLKKLMAARQAGITGPLSADVFFYRRIARDIESPDFAFAPKAGFEPVPMGDFYPLDDFDAAMDDYTAQERLMDTFDAKSENEFYMTAKSMEGILLWQELSVEVSQVRRLKWEDAHTLTAEIGSESGEKRRLTLVDGKIVSNQIISAFTAFDETPEALAALTYPCVPGRQYKAHPSAFTPWQGGWLVGTRDGMLSRVREDGSVFGLGMAAQNGPVRAITTDPEQTVAYGVAGDRADLGNIFRYDEKEGLRWLGMVYRSKMEEGITLAANELSCIALSPDGKTLAIGSCDRIGAIFLYSL